jgi:serine/threonine protein kinase
MAIQGCHDFANADGYEFLGLHTPYFSVQLCRLFIFLLLFVYVWRQRKTILLGQEDVHPERPFLLLPAYFDFLRLFIFYIFFVTVINLSVGETMSPFGFAIQVGLFHFFYDGLWFFFTQYGAGSRAFARSFWFGALSGIGSTFIFAVVARNLRDHDNNAWFPVLLWYNVVYIILFALPLVIPKDYMYGRPPMKVYSGLMCVYHSLYLSFIVLIRNDNNSGYCVAVTVYILFDCILKPFVVVSALSVDSAYWQGTDSAHPLAGIWTVGVDIASSIAAVDNRQLTVPFIHFGLIQLDKDVGFVAGGFSRVYFGKVRDAKVALKMLFVIELTPGSISDFCREADIIHGIKHPNIISCLGVCIMPPAISIVLEYCALGSLFDVLYRPRKSDSRIFGHSMRSSIFRSRILTNLSSNQSYGRHTLQSNPMSSAEQEDLELRPSMRALALRSSKSGRQSDASQAEDRSSSLRKSAATGATDPQTQMRTLFAESRAGLVSPWEGVALLCDAAAAGRPLPLPAETPADPAGDAAPEIPAAEAPTRDGLNPLHENGSAAAAAGLAGGAGGPPRVSDNVHMGGESSAHRFTSMFQRSSVQGPPSLSAAPPERRSIFDATARTATGAELLRSDMPAYLLDGLSPIHNLSVRGIIEVLCDVTRGVAILHQREFKHCDIKSLNFLLTDNYRVKLADMGEARAMSTVTVGDSRPPIPAMNWCCPEVLHPGATSTAYTAASDVFGLCMVLSEVILLVLPLEDARTKKQTYEMWRKMLVSGRRPELPSYLPKQLTDIISAGWATDPAERPTAESVLRVLEAVLAAASGGERRIEPENLFDLTPDVRHV